MITDNSEQGEMFSRSFLTKMDIAQALNRLCEDHPFSKIKVDAIAQEAEISRSSFYYHFPDRNAVVQWLSLYFYENGLDQTGRTLTWFEGHMITTRGFLRFHTLFTSASAGTEYGAARPYFIRHRQENLAETVADYQKKELTPLLEFQIEALPHAEMIMSNQYADGQYRLSLKEYCSFMTSLVPKELYEALEHPVERTTFKGDFL